MIDSLLYFGYHPTCSRAGLPDAVVEAVHTEPHPNDYQTLLDQGESALQYAIDAELSNVSSNRTHIVPLSSGLDSRTILAALIEHPDIEKRDITTVSFGTPGTWDYEISQKVAATAGVDNKAINLTADTFDWSESSLREYAETRNCPTRLIEGYVNYTVSEICSNDSVIWSGYLGDPSAGAHQPRNPTSSWEEACNYFVDYNQHTTGLASPSFDPMSLLPEDPYLRQDELTYEEQLDFAHRQQCFIWPLVICDENRYLTPFLNPKWLKFSLNLPPEYRQDRSLFIDLVTEKYPRLFSLPTDMRSGLSPNTGKLRWLLRIIRMFSAKKISRIVGLDHVDASLNYIDFERTLRCEGQFQTTAKSLLSSFDERSEKQIRHLWDEHQVGKDRSNEIRAICSAELYLSKIK